jgi:hypothetical protein
VVFHFTVYDSNFGTRVIVCGGRIVSVLNVQNNESSRYIQCISSYNMLAHSPAAYKENIN